MNDLTFLTAAHSPPIQGDSQVGMFRPGKEKPSTATAFAELLKARSNPTEFKPQAPTAQPDEGSFEISRSQQSTRRKSQAQEDQEPGPIEMERKNKEKSKETDEATNDQPTTEAQSAAAASQSVSQPRQETAGDADSNPGQSSDSQAARGVENSTGGLPQNPAENAAKLAALKLEGLVKGQLAETTKAELNAGKAADADGKAADLSDLQKGLKADQTLQKETPGLNPAAANPQDVTAVQSAVKASGSAAAGAAVKINPQTPPVEPGQNASAEPKIQAAPSVPNGTNPMVAEYRADRTTATTLPLEPARMSEARNAEIIKQVSGALETLVKNGEHTFRMQLSPDDLGKIDLCMTTRPDGLQVVLTADQAATGKMLESDLNRLRQSLQDAGIQLAQLSVNQHGAQGQTAQERHAARNKPGRSISTQAVSAVGEENENLSSLSAKARSLIDYQA